MLYEIDDRPNLRQIEVSVTNKEADDALPKLVVREVRAQTRLYYRVAQPDASTTRLNLAEANSLFNAIVVRRLQKIVRNFFRQWYWCRPQPWIPTIANVDIPFLVLRR